MTGRKTSESYFAVSSIQSPVCGLSSGRYAQGAKRYTQHLLPYTLFSAFRAYSLEPEILALDSFTLDFRLLAAYCFLVLALDSQLLPLNSQRLAQSVYTLPPVPYTLFSSWRALPRGISFPQKRYLFIHGILSWGKPR